MLAPQNEKCHLCKQIVNSVSSNSLMFCIICPKHSNKFKEYQKNLTYRYGGSLKFFEKKVFHLVAHAILPILNFYTFT